MDTAQVGSWMEQAQPILVAFGLKVIGAIAGFIIGRWLIHLVTRLVGAAIEDARGGRGQGLPGLSA
jgi:small conductance mechanosensitive channel